jgi:hypothetical protein
VDEQSSILKQIPDALIVDLTHSIQAKGKSASGKTIEALESAATDHTAQLLAPAHINALEFGRKPTSPGAPKGDPTLYDIIVEWCGVRGIDEGAAWPITKHIHEFGYAGTPGVLTEPLSDQNVNKRVDETVGKLATLLTTTLANQLHI